MPGGPHDRSDSAYPTGTRLASLNPEDPNLMAKKPLRSQLNQIRAWVREGRTDAWIAHQLDIPASELREFRRRHGLSPSGDEDAAAEDDLRDEIEAEIEAAALEEDEEEEEEEEEEQAAAEAAAPAREPSARVTARPSGSLAEDAAGSEGAPKRRRRRRRRRRGGGRKKALQGTFDHGETDGFGLWLDPAIQDEPAYSEHWAGHRAVEVEVEADRIVIKRSE
jgi:hypothetical protein